MTNSTRNTTMMMIVTILMTAASLFANYSVEAFETETIKFQVTTGNAEDDSLFTYNWFKDGEQLTEETVKELFFITDDESAGNYIVKCVASNEFASIDFVWDVVINDLVSSDIEDINTPKRTEVFQNYPNPFNPETSISYDMAKAGHVKIAVYNHKGEVVRNLVNEHKEAGKYSIKFDGNALTSGVYFYHMAAENFSKTMRAVMVK